MPQTRSCMYTLVCKAGIIPVYMFVQLDKYPCSPRVPHRYTGLFGVMGLMIRGAAYDQVDTPDS